VVNGSASIGIALYPEDATTAESLLSTADSAMYTAKFTRAKSRGTLESRHDHSLMTED
jgi:predicted signal transduction protein with EAL and GGDEF domain